MKAIFCFGADRKEFLAFRHSLARQKCSSLLRIPSEDSTKAKTAFTAALKSNNLPFKYLLRAKEALFWTKFESGELTSFLFGIFSA
jgi:hypothetical protein